MSDREPSRVEMCKDEALWSSAHRTFWLWLHLSLSNGVFAVPQTNYNETLPLLLDPHQCRLLNSLFQNSYCVLLLSVFALT